MNPIKIANALDQEGSVVLAEPDFAVKAFLAVYRPADVSARVHDKQRGSADNLIHTWRAADAPALRALLDTHPEIHGVWKLHVIDQAAGEVGKLNARKLELPT